MNTTRTLLVAVLGALLLFTTARVYAVPTEIVVRVLSRDAKFVGTSMGGARITLSDAQTGEVLASGVTRGSTGSTKKVMHADGGRRAVLHNENSGAFSATLDLHAPRQIKVEAIGPLGQMQAANTVTATQWVVPGKHLNGGDGWLLELPGFAVDILAPPAHVRLEGAIAEVTVKANIVMMCGCPIEPGGLWNADGYEVVAMVEHNDETLGRYPLRFAGETSQFATAVPVDSPGLYVVTVYAYDAATGNTGVDSTTFFAP